MTNSKKAIALMLVVTLLVGLGIGVGGYFLVSRLTNQKPEIIEQEEEEEKDETRVVDISEPDELENDDLLEYVWYEDEYIKFLHLDNTNVEIETSLFPDTSNKDYYSDSDFPLTEKGISKISVSNDYFAINLEIVETRLQKKIFNDGEFIYDIEKPNQVKKVEYAAPGALIHEEIIEQKNSPAVIRSMKSLQGFDLIFFEQGDFIKEGLTNILVFGTTKGEDGVYSLQSDVSPGNLISPIDNIYFWGKHSLSLSGSLSNKGQFNEFVNSIYYLLDSIEINNIESIEGNS
jgi:hypothetical protein